MYYFPPIFGLLQQELLVKPRIAPKTQIETNRMRTTNGAAYSLHAESIPANKQLID